jgi:hypothetical protein
MKLPKKRRKQRNPRHGWVGVMSSTGGAVLMGVPVAKE